MSNSSLRRIADTTSMRNVSRSGSIPALLKTGNTHRCPYWRQTCCKHDFHHLTVIYSGPENQRGAYEVHVERLFEKVGNIAARVSLILFTITGTTLLLLPFDALSV
jgi:hypothetical protein